MPEPPNPPAQDVAQSRLPPLTTSGGIQMGMTPPHPGAFIRIEVIEEWGSSVSAAVTQVGMTRGTLCDEGVAQFERN